MLNRGARSAVVVGLGAAGSAAAYHLARRGVRVTGLDRFAPPHAMGSSHGRTRIIREAYFEHPLYVPLVRRAYELWAELEAEAGERLLAITGGLMAGPREGALVAGALRSAHEHGLPYEMLDAREANARFPAFALEHDWVGLLEPRAGMLFPERCVSAHLAGARGAGAELRTNEPALRWRADGAGVVVETAAGEHRADALVLAAGPWTAGLLPELALPLEIARQTLHYFEPAAEKLPLLDPSRCPIAIWEHDRDRFFYSFPAHEGRVKCAVHHEGETARTPEAVRRDVDEADTAPVRALLERIIPAARGPLRESTVCLYTNTPDWHFVIDRHPAHRRVVVASACSGHGFKFASAVGELVADLTTGTPPRFDPAPFAISRFAGRATA
ncbi:MAG: N-methyl-L-tryptophan oxidase [Gemmatimonadaceae bacterium]